MEAHGGLHRCETIKEIVAHIRCGGAVLTAHFSFF
jgi:hypothetical protein